MARILIADDDVELCAMLKEYLVDEGFSMDAAHDGESALKRAVSDAYDLVILDVTMPKKNGLDVLRELRMKRLTPVLMLTARGDDVDSIVGLELGADDYLAKPCNPRVLAARIRAVLRRAEPASQPPETVALECGDLRLDSASRKLHLAGKPVELTSTEFSVLEILLREAGRAVTKSDLSSQALGRKLGRFDRSLDMHVSNLRRKLGPLPDGSERIATVRNVGYQYVLN